MELHFMGVKPFPLGTVQDYVSRLYLQKRRAKGLRSDFLSIMTRVDGADPKALTSEYNKYVYDVLDLNDMIQKEEDYLRQEYEKIRHQSPKIHKDASGGIKVTGI